VAQQRLIVEWFSPDFHQVYLRPFEAMVFLLIIGFALKRPSLYELLLALVALGLALQSVRNVALFVAVATPVMINSYSLYWKELSQRRGWKLELPPRRIFAVITAIVLVVIILATTLHIADSVSPARQQSLDTASYPVAAADWLQAHPEVGTKMYNQYGWGGYLAYRFYPNPNRRVFIFGEAALMGDPLLNEYQDVQTLRSDWKQVLDRPTPPHPLPTLPLKGEGCCLSL
jgi:amino acid transporter